MPYCISGLSQSQSSLPRGQLVWSWTHYTPDCWMTCSDSWASVPEVISQTYTAQWPSKDFVHRPTVAACHQCHVTIPLSDWGKGRVTCLWGIFKSTFNLKSLNGCLGAGTLFSRRLKCLMEDLSHKTTQSSLSKTKKQPCVRFRLMQTT